MRAKEIIAEAESYQPPELSVGDEVSIGKFKNRKAEIKGFAKDKHNQPVLKTNKGPVQLFKPRVAKLMKESSIFGRNKTKIYNLMVNKIDCGPFDGGCVTVAMALQMALGGEIVVLVGTPHGNTSEEAAQHAALSLNGKLIDGDGPLPVKAFVNRFVNAELKHVGGYITGVRAIEPGDLPEAPRDNELAIQIAKLMSNVEVKEEIIDEYEQGTDNSRQIFAKLKSLGYKKLGSGQDATVWSKDEASVIKILMPSRAVPGPAQDAERGFLAFYNFCQQYPDNPNLPKFIDIGGAHHTVFELNGVPYRQIAMEKLQPIKNGSFEEAMVWMLSDLVNSTRDWNGIVELLKQPDTWSVEPSMAKMPELVSEKLSDPVVNRQYGILYLTMRRLYAAGQKAGLGWDLHTENIMQRKDGTLVIVDPYFT